MPRLDVDRDAYVARFDFRSRWLRRVAILLDRLGLIQESVQSFVYDRVFRNDIDAVTFAYAKTNDHLPDLDRPRWYNEKVRWLFVNHPNPLMTLVADKIAVRRYLEFRGARIDPPRMLACGSEPRDLMQIGLPESFVLKSAYGSGQNHIERAGDNTPRSELVEMCDRWMEWDQWRRTGELHYRGVPKRWLIEEFVPSSAGQVEYKIFCMMGKPAFILVISDRSGDSYKRMIYDTEWHPVDFHWQVTPPVEERPVPRPAALEAMLADARLLSTDFLQVRVDFLQCDERIVFSELTFASAAARIPFTPEAANVEIGDLIDLDRAEEYLERGRRVFNELSAARKASALVAAHRKVQSVGRGALWVFIGSATEAPLVTVPGRIY